MSPKKVDPAQSRRRRFVIGCSLISAMLAFAADRAGAQADAPPPPLPASNEDLLRELRQMRQEFEQVKQEAGEARQLKEQVEQLQQELSSYRQSQAGPGMPSAPSPSLPGSAPGGDFSGGGSSNESSSSTVSQSGPEVPSEAAQGEDAPLRASYKYQTGTGPLGGGGYTRLADRDEEFTVNLTNQITVDGTFFDRRGMPTIEQGFNIPFARTFLYGNITKDWKYQIGTQGFLGTFNLLDLYMSYQATEWMNIRFGRGLTPPLYEYYAFTPALEPVITNSPLFQLAGKRQLGVMFTGNILKQRLQYWAGITNSATGLYYNLDRNMDFNGAVDLTPFKGTETVFESLGGGVGFSAGTQDYKLQQINNFTGTGDIGFANNGEATTNGSYVTSSGIPFFAYNPDVRALGMRTRVAPHIYWYGRLSVLAEYINHSRELVDRNNAGRSTQRGYYVNVSYFLTGERDFNGNGNQGYTPIEPLRPFIPSRHQYGPGAWQLAAQFSELNVGTGDFARGFADPTRWTNRLDQLMVGVNWWPNKYTRLSFDYVWTGFNNAIQVNGPSPIDSFNTFWCRFAMFL